jgi:phage shock protein C
MKNLYRIRNNRIFGGVFGGLGRYLNIDPTILRIIWVTLTVFTGFFPGIVIYFSVLLLIPEEPFN